MGIREKMIEAGCRVMCRRNNMDPDFISSDIHVTLGRESRPNWRHWESTVTEIIDASLSEMKKQLASTGEVS